MNEHELISKLAAILTKQQEVLKRLAQSSGFQWIDQHNTKTFAPGQEVQAYYDSYEGNGMYSTVYCRVESSNPKQTVAIAFEGTNTPNQPGAPSTGSVITLPTSYFSQA